MSPADVDIDDLAAHISEGGTLRQWCRDNEVSHQTVYRAINSSKENQDQIARARDLGYDAIAEDCFDIADGAEHTSEGVQHAKLRIWTRTQLLAKWQPAKYGDKQHVTHANDKDQPITIVTGVPQPREKDPGDDVDLSAFE